MDNSWTFEHDVSENEFRRMSEDSQIDLMRQWFHERYEDPNECCPYETREGGYQWIWGSPSEPWDVLESEFGGVASSTAIQKLSDELFEIACEWSPVPEYGDFDEDYALSIQSSEDPLETLEAALSRIERIIGLDVSDAEDRQGLLQLSLVGVVAGVEAFFSDLFIGGLTEDEDRLRRFVESNPEMGKRRLALSEIFSRREDLEKEVRGYLASFLWHKLKAVQQMYKDTFSIKFPNYFPILEDAIQLRHDIVHRGGKTVDGEGVSIEKEMVINLLDLVRNKSVELRDLVFYEPF